MKKSLFFALTLPIFLFANQKYELKLYETIFSSIFKHKDIKIYADEEDIKMLQESSKIEVVPTCTKETTLLLGKKFINLPDVCRNKPLFSTNYRDYKKMPNSFGVFYWRKGRPQIKFKKKALLLHHITLPKSLQKYAK